MSETDKIFAGPIPALYDRYLGSMIFERYAVDLAARFGDLVEGRLLELAVGTGIVTRALGLNSPASPPSSPPAWD